MEKVINDFIKYCEVNKKIPLGKLYDDILNIDLENVEIDYELIEKLINTINEYKTYKKVKKNKTAVRKANNKLKKNYDIVCRLIDYIYFMEKYKELPQKLNTKIDNRTEYEDESESLADFIKKMKLEDIYIPYPVIERFNNLKNEYDGAFERKIYNCLMINLIDSVRYYGILPTSCFSDGLFIRTYYNNNITINRAYRVIKKNIKYIDDTLIDKYNNEISKLSLGTTRVKKLKK